MDSRFAKKGELVRNNLSTSVTVRFFRELAWLLESGCSPTEAFVALQEATTENPMKRLLDRLGVPRTDSVADWLGNAPETFPAAIIQAIRHAEERDKIPECLEVLASDLFRIDVLEDGGRGILFYPAAIMLIMGVLGIIYSIFVLPAFEEFFNSVGAELPTATRLAITLGNWLILPLLLLTFLVVITNFLTSFSNRASRLLRLGRELTQQLLALIGYRQFRAQLVWGRITQIAAASSQYALDPATMLRAAAANTLDTAEAGLLRHAAEGLCNKNLPDALLSMPTLPHFIREMVIIGNKTKRLEEALALAGTMARELALNKIGVIRQRFEVTVAIIMGLFVGFMLIAMYEPIFQMGQAVS